MPSRIRTSILVLVLLAALATLPAQARRDSWRAGPSEGSDPGLAAVLDALHSTDPGLLEGHLMGPVQIPVPGMSLAIEDGTIWLEPPVEGRTRGLFVTGKTSLSWTPASPTEARMLELHMDGMRRLDISPPWFYLWSATPSPLALAASNAEAVEGPCPESEAYTGVKEAFAFHGLDAVAQVLNGLGPSRGTVRVIFPVGKELLQLGVDPLRPEEITLERFGNIAGGDLFWWQTYCSQRRPGPGVDPMRPVIRQRDLERVQLADVKAYRIDLEIDEPTGRAVVRVEMDLSLTRDDLTVLPLELAQHLQVESVSDGEGRALPHLQWEWDESETGRDHRILVELPEGSVSGRPFTLVFAYDGPMFDTQISSWSPLIDEDDWFPHPLYEVDGATFETSFAVDDKADVIAVGELVSSKEEGGIKRMTYRSTVPEKHATIQFGVFRTAKEEADELQVESYVPGALATGGGDTIFIQDASGQVLGLDPAKGVVAKTTAREVANALKTMVPLFGPMEGETLRVSTTTGGYGRGFHSLLLVPTIRYLGAANWEGQMFLAHEVAHQWFGHQVSPTDYFREAWLSEGFAEFASLEYIRLRYGAERAADALRRYRKRMLDSGPHGVREQIGPISMGQRLIVWKGRPESVYSEVVYEKGAYVLEMIRGLFLMTRGSEEPFFEMMREFVEASRTRRTCTEDFRLAVERSLGLPMDWFFDQWVYGTGIPKLEVRWVRTEGGYTFTVEQDPATEYQLLLPVTFHFSGKEVAGGILKVKPGTSKIHVPMDRTARTIGVNEKEEVLAIVTTRSRN